MLNVQFKGLQSFNINANSKKHSTVDNVKSEMDTISFRSTKTVKLRTGVDSDKTTVEIFKLAMRMLYNTSGLRALEALFNKCNDPNYNISSSDAYRLKNVGLMQDDGNIPKLFIEIAKAAIEPNGYFIKLVDPVTGSDHF